MLRGATKVLIPNNSTLNKCAFIQVTQNREEWYTGMTDQQQSTRTSNKIIVFWITLNLYWITLNLYIILKEQNKFPETNTKETKIYELPKNNSK